MRAIVASILGLSLLYNAPLIMRAEALDTEITSNFSGNPFNSGDWCERWHHVHHFGFPNWHMRASDSEFPLAGECEAGPGSFGSCCANPADCQDEPDPTPAFCSSTTPAFFLITQDDYEGIDPRLAEVEFGLNGHLTTADHHLNTYSVTHPGCHGGVQGIISYVSGSDYRVGIAVGLDPEPGVCTGGGVAMGGSIVSPSATVTLATSTQTKYRLVTESSITKKPGSTDEIAASVKLFDLATGNQLGDTFSHVFTVNDATWYNGEAKRFGFGGGLDAPTNGYVVFDDFHGKAGC